MNTTLTDTPVKAQDWFKISSDIVYSSNNKEKICVHWGSNQKCIYSEMHRCNTIEYGCQYDPD